MVTDRKRNPGEDFDAYFRRQHELATSFREQLLDPTGLVSCLCGDRRYRTQDDADEAERSGADKCQTCRTFARDHEWYPGFDPEDNRCGDCDTRSNSHGSPRVAA